METSWNIVDSREAAEAALEAYRSSSEMSWDDDVAVIADLLADLLHLADAKIAEAVAEEGAEVAWDGAISAAGVAQNAIERWEEERDS